MKKIISDVYKYYPRNLKWGTKEYIDSKEFQHQIACLEEAKSDMEHQKMLVEDIKKQLTNYNVVDWTEYDEFLCIELRILLNENVDILDDDIALIQSMNGHRKDLLVFISNLERYYCYDILDTYYNDYTEQWCFKSGCGNDEKDDYIKKTIDNILQAYGYSLLGIDDVLQILPDIETEYKDEGKVTLFDCLFSQLISIG